MRTHWVMDLETMKNLFVAVFQDFKTDNTKIFIIHPETNRNDIKELIVFLKNNIKLKEWHVSFNGLSFDSQIIQYILENKTYFLKCSTDKLVTYLYDNAQETITKSKNNEFSKYPEWKLSIQQLDVFKINHWDNANKRTSLKWTQFSMDWLTLQDMPIHHTVKVNTQEEVDIIVKYCINDVESTKKIMHLSKPLIDVRIKIKNKYDLNCYNYSNTKLGSELLLKLYCDATGKNKKNVKENGTYRNGIKISEILFPYIRFDTAPFQNFLEKLHDKIIWDTKNDFKFQLKFKGNEFFYGAGGIHQCIEPGIYLADDEFIIKDLDVASLYPSIACVNEMYPAHLGKEFFQVYKNDIVDVRLNEKLKPKDQRDVAIIEGFKEAANATYGNSNSEYSWLFDSSYTMQTTINGQLLLSMLIEKLLVQIPDALLLQTNTDGATLKFKKEYLPIYEQICKEWEINTKLTLEFADYKAMYIWDVNNYISVYTDGKAKCKGRFEWEDLENHKYSHLHKNKSNLIVAKTIFNYFVNGIDPETYINSNKNIFDYCGGVKIKGDWKFVEHCVKEGDYIKNELQHTLRYYISNSGSKIIKTHFSNDREIQIEAGQWMQTVFINYVEKPFEEYNINLKYYIQKVRKEIDALEQVTKQLILL